MKPAAQRRGLTLMEVALAVAILAIMATLTWGSLARYFDAYETVTDIDHRYHNVRVAMNRMSKELSMAFLTNARRYTSPERLEETLFQAKRATPFFELNFTSFAHEILRADAKESDSCEIGYYGERDPDNSSVYNLMRREDPRIDTDPEKGGRSYILAENVKDFRLRFWDPKTQDWVDEWDTEKAEYIGRLPTVVEIKLVVLDENGEELTFLTKTRVNLIQELGKI